MSSHGHFTTIEQTVVCVQHVECVRGATSGLLGAPLSLLLLLPPFLMRGNGV
jgi:hypothetical protein